MCAYVLGDLLSINKCSGQWTRGYRLARVHHNSMCFWNLHAWYVTGPLWSGMWVFDRFQDNEWGFNCLGIPAEACDWHATFVWSVWTLLWVLQSFVCVRDHPLYFSCRWRAQDAFLNVHLSHSSVSIACTMTCWGVCTATHTSLGFDSQSTTQSDGQVLYMSDQSPTF